MVGARLCCHCLKPYVQSGRKTRRGLCYPCYNNPVIRKQNPPLETHEGDFYGGKGLPSEPTSFPPGSEDKIAVLAARVEAKVSLWHPLDRPGDDE